MEKGDGMAASSPPKKVRNLIVRVEDDVFDFLHEESARYRIPMSQIIRDMIYRRMEERRSDSGESK